jgi:integrase/recombinase XerD
MSSKTKNLSLSQCIEGALFYKRASGKSPATISDYRNCFNKLLLYFTDDPPLSPITRAQLIEFFDWLHNVYISHPGGVIKRPSVKLSPKSLLNIHTAVSALWTWAVEEGIAERNLVHSISAPKVNDPVIETFTKEQTEALLQACERTAKYKDGSSNERPTADRDRSIVLLLLDSGIRAQELCGITIGDANLNGNSIKITGKGSKERIVYFGKRTAKAIWKYLLPRINTMKPDDYLFLVDYPNDPRQMDRKVLGHLLKRIGDRAGVPNVHPHRFRHTFAITYLRNGGDVFTLQNLLGHSSLEMVKRYARIAQMDCARVHQTASPVDNWKL